MTSDGHDNGIGLFGRLKLYDGVDNAVERRRMDPIVNSTPPNLDNICSTSYKSAYPSLPNARSYCSLAHSLNKDLTGKVDFLAKGTQKMSDSSIVEE